MRAFAGLAELRAGDVLLELGAGTGQLGACFPALGVRYIGLDASAAMLAEFEPRLAVEPRSSVRLLRADVDAGWPVERDSVRAVFSSRAAHLFERDHVVRETVRVARGPRASFTLGRVQRDDGAMRSIMRREMRALLVARGFAPRDGERRQRGVLAAFGEQGAARLGPITAARWTVRTSPRSVLDAWRGKPGLGGCEPPEPVKSAVLDELEAWAATRFASLDAPEQAEERYILEGVSFEAGARG